MKGTVAPRELVSAEHPRLSCNDFAHFVADPLLAVMIGQFFGQLLLA